MARSFLREARNIANFRGGSPRAIHPTMTNTQETVAQKISSMYGNDGLCWYDDEGVHLSERCAESAMQTDDQPDADVRRYTFHDGSVITVAGSGWDFGYEDCFCWAGAGHDPDHCTAAIAESDDGVETVGTRVEGGDTWDDYDTGVVTAVEGEQVTVAWDSGVTTTQHASALRAEGTGVVFQPDGSEDDPLVAEPE